MTLTGTPAPHEKLASYQRCIQRIHVHWSVFLEKRQQRLKQQERRGSAPEKVAENIIEDLLTEVLDWEIADFNYQMDYADIVLTKTGIKYLLVETKRPGALAWNQRAVEKALEQAVRYASEQKVKCVAISDGTMLYSANFLHGGLEDRLFVSLADPIPPLDLWWLSVHGIYRPHSIAQATHTCLLPQENTSEPCLDDIGNQLLHPKLDFVHSNSITDSQRQPLKSRAGH